MKKIVLVVALIFLTTGCFNKKTITYKINDEEVELTFDLSDDFIVDEKSPFTLKKGLDKCIGIFFQKSMYNNYLTSIAKDTSVRIINEGKTKELEYIIYQKENEEYNYLIKFKNKNTGMILRNKTSLESVQDCFNHIKF